MLVRESAYTSCFQGSVQPGDAYMKKYDCAAGVHVFQASRTVHSFDLVASQQTGYM